MIGESVESSSSSSSSLSNPVLKELNVDYTLYGYALFCFGSDLYFIESLQPYYPGLFANNEHQFIGLTAAILFVLESGAFMCGWIHHRDRVDHQHIQLLLSSSSSSKSNIDNNNSEQLQSLTRSKSSSKVDSDDDDNDNDDMSDVSLSTEPDWNLWANALFLIGSIGYVLQSSLEISDCCNLIPKFLNLGNSIIFVLDGIFYWYGLQEGETARAPRADNIPIIIHSKINLYAIATFTFIFASIAYFISAILIMINFDYRGFNMLGAILNAISALIYFLSAFQFREVHVN